jgi:hypothetical protein
MKVKGGLRSRCKQQVRKDVIQIRGKTWDKTGWGEAVGWLRKMKRLG